MKIYIVIVGLLISVCSYAQVITGKVTNNNQEPLIGASVYWVNATSGTTTNDQGEFEITLGDEKKLVASYVGHQPDTIEVTNQTFITFQLNSAENLEEVVVKERKDGVIFSNINAIKTEQITATELKKAACCDLAGCFGTQTSVQPQTTNVITNAKELRILGLSGVYNQVLIDGFPMIQGLSYTYGISSVPGTLVDNIFISKGTNSVLQGYESIAGQINVITKEPDNTDPLLVNFYINSFMEKHVNVNYAFKKGKWSNIAAFHTVQPANRIDRDDDDFLDLPLLTRYMVSNKWKYGKEGNWGWNSKIGVRFLNENRVGGQEFFDAAVDKGSTTVYGQSVRINQPEIWTKSGYRFDDNNNLAFYASAYHQNQNSYFGTVRYDARQTNVYANAQYEKVYNTHDIKTGVSFRHLNINEEVGFTDDGLSRTYAGNYQRIEYIPGIFAENTMRFLDDRLTWIAGLRADHHNQFGLKITPRTLVKFDFSAQSTIRANIGKGWRTANIFSENINLLVSSRDIIFEEALQPEEAINYGVNYLHKYEFGTLSGYISTDFYSTTFQNQIFPDYDTDATQAIIKNYTGTSISNGFQVEVLMRFGKSVEVKTGYNYLDVFRQEGDTKVLLPFNSKHNLLATFSYRPTSDKFHIDFNAHWYGQQRLPNTASNPLEFQRPDFSAPFTIFNTQFTYNFDLLELYAGVENIFDFRQRQPIISWENPFGPYFDTSSVWGPTRGREIYVGFRYYLKEKE